MSDNPSIKNPDCYLCGAVYYPGEMDKLLHISGTYRLICDPCEAGLRPTEDWLKIAKGIVSQGDSL